MADILIAALLLAALPLLAQENAEHYRVDPPAMPEEDLSGDMGPRLLALLSTQAERNLRAIEADRQKAGLESEYAIATDIQYPVHFLAGSAYAFGVLARYGKPGKTMAGTTRERLDRTAAAIVEALARTHKLGEGEKEWHKFNSCRFVHLLGMAAWLVWDKLSVETQSLVARMVAHEADRFLDAPAPARLFIDTQAESNAWTGGGLAVAGCMLKHHPRRTRWAEKANEYMISAYATANDVESKRVVDGKPLKEWLTGPNAFPDYTVENHGIVHADYLAAISEMVRSAIAFRLAGEPVPKAVTFNAAHVFERLMFLSLPDGTHLYPQGTDYTPRRIDSFFQACNIVPLLPNPRPKAYFLRSLASLEVMADEWPTLPMSGWVGIPYDLGSTWGLTQNYLMCRLFGDGGDALSDANLEESLAGVHVSEMGRFVVHRTRNSLASFSWHPRSVMGMAMPLDRDTLCYPLPWGYVGEVREAEADSPDLKVRSHRVATRDDGFAVIMELDWCERKVRQSCAFVSLPDGASVYLEERRAVRDVTLSLVKSGTVAIFDDVRWPYQAKPRGYFAARGALVPMPDEARDGNWVNVDDRMGYAVLGASRFRLAKRKGRPCIWRGEGTMYDTCRLEFAPAMDRAAPAAFRAGERISAFAMVSCPNQDRAATAALASNLDRAGWVHDADGVLALAVGNRLIYSNFAASACRVTLGNAVLELQPGSAGWQPLR